MKFSANLSWLFTEYPLEARFTMAHEAGFKAVELLFPYELKLEQLGQLLLCNSLKLDLINAPAGAWQQGQRGFAGEPYEGEAFRQSMKDARRYATTLGCHKIHVMAGHRHHQMPFKEQLELYRQRLLWAADYLANEPITLLIEPLNLQDMPNYFLNSFDVALSLLESCDRPNLRLQFDVYHCALLHQQVSRYFEHCRHWLGHVQIASVPDRHEPDGGKVDYSAVFEQLQALGYEQYIGCEYQPRGHTEDGLGWRSCLAIGEE